MARSFINGGDTSGAYLSLLTGLVAINFYYCRTTHRMLRETIRLRLENVELVGHLQEERDRAQAAERQREMIEIQNGCGRRVIARPDPPRRRRR